MHKDLCYKPLLSNQFLGGGGGGGRELAGAQRSVLYTLAW